MTVLAHDFGTFAVKQAKISKMLTDPVAGLATYSSSVSCPGIREIKLVAKIKSETNYGDMQILSAFGVVEGMDLSFQNAELGMDALAVMFGGTVTDAGTTPNQTATYTQLGNTDLAYFKFEGRCTAVDSPGADVHLVVWKAIVTASDIGFPLAAYQVYTYGALAVTPRATTPAGIGLYSVIENEVAVAIS